jgi:hypothetical protein
MTTTEAPGTAASNDPAVPLTASTDSASTDSASTSLPTMSVPTADQGVGAGTSRRPLRTAEGAAGGYLTPVIDGAARTVSRPGRPGPRHAAQRALLERNRALTLIHSGQAATATVDTLCDTGVRVNGRAVAEVHLLVERPGSMPYPVVRSAVVPEADMDLTRAAIASSGRPRRIPVLVDPRRPENVLLRWDLRPAS